MHFDAKFFEKARNDENNDVEENVFQELKENIKSHMMGLDFLNAVSTYREPQTKPRYSNFLGKRKQYKGMDDLTYQSVFERDKKERWHLP